MNPNQALWEKGDFTRIAAGMRDSGQAPSGAGDPSGMDVLDLGCGDGTTALPAAALGADVWGSTSPATSSRPVTIERRSLGLSNCRFEEGDASDLRGSKTRASTSSSASSARCSRRSHTMSRRRSSGSPGPVVGSSWAIGSPTTRRSSPRS